MNSQKLFALTLVFSLVGSAVAAHTANVTENTLQPAEGVELVQQHSVFVELIMEENEHDDKDVIDNFGAVVGLVKQCKMQDRGMFDNAVLWFNDQFLFGTKEEKEERNPMGINPNRTHDSVAGEGGFVHENYDANGDLIERWGGCWIPVGFAHAFQSAGNDPDAVREAIEADHVEETQCDIVLESLKEDRDIDTGEEGETVCETEDGQVIRVGGTDRGSKCGAINDNHSHYVTDPNGFQWVIDVSDCDDIEGFLYTVHLQVDPSTNQGIADRADWAYTDGTLRQGAPIAGPDDDIWQECKDAGPLGPDKCTLEYSFLLAINLDLHSPTRGEDDPLAPEHCPEGERFDDRNWALEGESHPHNPEENECGDTHTHPTLDMDIMFHDKAPAWIHDNPYWDSEDTDQTTTGTPPEVQFGSGPGNWDDCMPQSINAESSYQEDAIWDRNFRHPCDSVQDRGFHAHDGSQTTYPS